jgi:hypothetical protein
VAAPSGDGLRTVGSAAPTDVTAQGKLRILAEIDHAPPAAPPPSCDVKACILRP